MDLWIALLWMIYLGAAVALGAVVGLWVVKRDLEGKVEERRQVLMPLTDRAIARAVLRFTDRADAAEIGTRDIPNSARK